MAKDLKFCTQNLLLYCVKQGDFLVFGEYLKVSSHQWEGKEGGGGHYLGLL